MNLEQEQKDMRSRSAVYDGRHRNKQKPLPEGATDEEYWESVLQREGLGVHQGEKRWLKYTCSNVNVANIHAAVQLHRESGKPRSKGHGPDDFGR